MSQEFDYILQLQSTEEKYKEVIPRLYIVCADPSRPMHGALVVWRLDIVRNIGRESRDTEKGRWWVARRHSSGTFHAVQSLHHFGTRLLVQHFGLTDLKFQYTTAMIVDMSPADLTLERRGFEAEYPSMRKLDLRSDNPFDRVPANFVS